MLRRNIGCVFQDFKLLPNRTAAENVAYALKVQGESSASIRKKVPEVLSMVGLSHKMNSLPDELSGGEQQRVSIARAFVNHPPLLVCDEPTGNLDPDTSVGIMQLLYRINRSGTTILMVTHDREMVDKMRKRVIQLEDGRLARDERRGGYDGRMRFRLLVSEAWRALGANLSTTFAATMTVLSACSCSGSSSRSARGRVSWSNHVKRELVVKVDFKTDRRRRARRRTPSSASSTQNPYVKPGGIKYVSKEQALAQHEEALPGARQEPAVNPLPTRSR